MPQWSVAYLSQLIRKERYDVDPQEVRKYFAYDNVRDGILKLAEDLFGVEIRKWDTPLWAPGVEAYEMLEGGKVIGRFYMDNHPREGKYSHANAIPIRTGLTGRALPVGSARLQLPGRRPPDRADGASRRRDLPPRIRPPAPPHVRGPAATGRRQNPFDLEWDFVEAPSSDARKLGVGL